MHIIEPDFWLVFETEDGGLVVVASTELEAAAVLDPDTRLLVGVARGFHQAHRGHHRIHLSSLTRWLMSAGLEWSRLDVDLANVLDRAASMHCPLP